MTQESLDSPFLRLSLDPSPTSQLIWYDSSLQTGKSRTRILSGTPISVQKSRISDSGKELETRISTRIRV